MTDSKATPGRTALDAGYEDAFARGYAAAQDAAADRAASRTFLATVLITVSIALCVIALIVSIAWYSNAAAERDNGVRQTCVSDGGVWTTQGTCVWSKAG